MARTAPPKLTTHQAAEVFRMLADEPRLRLLLLSAERGEMHVTALCGEVGMTQPAVSHCLTVLRAVGHAS
jgi:DNA-binding transcriptional ArsR family regulator